MSLFHIGLLVHTSRWRKPSPTPSFLDFVLDVRINGSEPDELAPEKWKKKRLVIWGDV